MALLAIGPRHTTACFSSMSKTDAHHLDADFSDGQDQALCRRRLSSGAVRRERRT